MIFILIYNFRINLMCKTLFILAISIQGIQDIRTIMALEAWYHQCTRLYLYVVNTLKTRRELLRIETLIDIAGVYLHSC